MTESFRSPRKIARRLRCLPLAFKKIRNWPTFIFCYALGLKPKRAYVFRSGPQLIITRGVDHVPVREIFLNQDYGIIPNDSTVLDLGAHIGVFSIYATTTARNVVVYAYEPHPEFCRALRENVGLNRREEAIHCFNAAVASETGARDLYLGSGQFSFPSVVGTTKGDNGERLVVPCTTLGEIIDVNRLEHIDLLKMDCEGAEYEILYSTSLSHLEKIAEIRMEYHNLDSHERHLDGLKRFFTRSGFTVTHLKPTSETNGTLWARRAR